MAGITPPKKNPTPKLERTVQLSWSKGWFSNGGQTEVPNDGLWIAENCVVSQSGSVRSRSNFNKSKVPDLPGESFTGPLFSFWNNIEEQYDLLAVCDGDLYMHVADTEEWSLVEQREGEVKFSDQQLLAYAQYGNLICIADGVNALAYFTVPNAIDQVPYVVRPGDEIDNNPGMVVSEIPATYELLYNGNGATSGETKDEAVYESGDEVTTVANGFSRDGYTFVGWGTMPTGTDYFAAGATFEMPASDLVLYAIWIENGATPDPDPKEPEIENGTLKTDYRAYYIVSYVNDFGETIGSGGTDFETDPQYVDIVLEDSNDPLGLWHNSVRVDVLTVDDTLSHNARVRVYRALTPDYLPPNVTNYVLVKEFPVSDGPQSFKDDGSFQGLLKTPQLANSTGGLPCRWIYEVDGRLWALGVFPEHQKIYYSGSAPVDSDYPQFFTGEGGYFYVAYGTSYQPVTIRRGRADDGQICNFTLLSGPNGKGRRFNIQSLETTYGDSAIFQYYGSEQHGDEGAYSTFGVVDYLNSILYPSPGGFKSSGLRAQYTGDNITASIDNAISDAVGDISYATFKNMYGTIYDHKAIWHTGPASMLVFDARVGGSWTYWTMVHDWFGSLTVGSEKDALYLVSGNKVLVYADRSDFLTRDSSGPENKVRVMSGRIMVKPEDGREWFQCQHVRFIFSALQGPIMLQVRANSRKGLETWTGQISVTQDVFGGTAYKGSEPVDWSTLEKEPNLSSEKGLYASPSNWSNGAFVMTRRDTAGLVELKVKINKNVNWIDWRIESLDGFLELELEEFVAAYVDIGHGPDYSSLYNEFRVPTVRNR